MVTIASLDTPKIADPVELPKPKPGREMPTTQDSAQPLSVPITEVVETTAPSRVELYTSSAPPTTIAVEARATTAAEPVRPPRFDADYLENPAPTYPALARRLGEQGNVMLRVYVNPSGDAEQVLVASSSGVTRLDAAAVEAVRRWKFAPAKQGSVSVAAWVLVPINFSLKS
jgi:protein TonB